MDTKTKNLKNNLMVQVNKIFNNTREGSYKTRARYRESCERFCSFLATEFKLQKFSNIHGKHITAYVKYMQDAGRSPSTIKTDLSGIRFAHSKCGGRNRLPDNNKLNLEKRTIGTINRAWVKTEIEGAKHSALEGKRKDVYHAINISSLFGLRIEGTCKMTVTHVERALEFGELYTKEKGGLERYIPITSEEQKQALKEVLSYAREQGKNGGDKAISDNVKYGVQKTMKSIQNWISNHQLKFRDDSLRRQEKIQELQKRAEKAGYKLRSKKLNFHGLRYHYAQNRFDELKKQGYSDKMVKLIVSKNLGHHRPDVTNIYLSKS